MTVYYWVLYTSHKEAEHRRESLESYGLYGGLFTRPVMLVRNAKVSKTRKGRYRIKWRVK